MNTINVNIKDLYFDPNNYRLQNNLKYENVEEHNVKSPAIQKRTFELITGGKPKKHVLIKDLINSIKTNGFLKVDNILARKLPEGGYLIIEGNRRLAALKVLKEDLETGYEIDELDASIFDEPKDSNDTSKGVEIVLVSEGVNGDHYNILMGLKHVSGNKKWHRFNQAKLLYNLYTKHDLSFADIAKKIGIETANQVKNEIYAYGVMLDYIDFVKNQEIDYNNFDPFDKFMIFLTLLSKPIMREWLKWDDKAIKFLNEDNKDRFYSWITPSEVLDEDSEDEIKYIKREPCIDNHKDIRILADYVDDNDFLTTMEETGSFQNTLNNDIRHSQKEFSKKLQSISNAINSITIDNINNMTDADAKIFNRISATINKLPELKN